MGLDVCLAHLDLGREAFLFSFHFSTNAMIWVDATLTLAYKFIASYPLILIVRIRSRRLSPTQDDKDFRRGDSYQVALPLSHQPSSHNLRFVNIIVGVGQLFMVSITSLITDLSSQK